MGSSMSNTTGYGLMIPYTEEEYEYDHEFPQAWADLLEKHDEDTWDLFNHLLKDYPALTWETTYLHDYTGATVIFVDALTTSSYGIQPLKVDDRLLYSPETYEYDKQLLEISRTIGMPLQDAADGLGLWSVVSYG